MQANARGLSVSWQQRWADPALTALAIELAVAVFFISPLGVLAPRGGLVLPVVLAALVVAPVLLTAVLVASNHGAAKAAVFVAIALIVTGIGFELQHPSVLVTWLHLIGALIMGVR